MGSINICFVTHLYPADEQDYKGIFVHEMASSLARSGHEVHVVTPRRPGAKKNEVRDGVIIHRHWFAGWRSGKQLGELKGTPPLMLGSLLLVGIWRCLRVVRVHRIRLLQGYWVVPGGFMAMVCGRLTGRPVVTTASGTDLNVVAHRRPIRPFVRATLKRIQCLMAKGSEMKRLAVELGMSPDRIREVSAFIGVDLPREGESRHRIDLPGRAGGRLICLGNLTFPKRVDTVLRAMRRVVDRLPDVHLTIVGDGDLRGELEALAAELRIEDNVHFRGACAHEEVFALLRGADLMIHASDREGLPVVIGEAMGAGLPVVASAVGGVPNLVWEGQTGYLVAPDDDEAYSERIVQLIEDDAMRRQMGEQAHDFARTELNKQAVIENIESIYKDVMETK